MKKFFTQIAKQAFRLLLVSAGVFSYNSFASTTLQSVGNYPGTLRGSITDMQTHDGYIYTSVNETGLFYALYPGFDLTIASVLNLDSIYSYGIYTEGTKLYLGRDGGIQLVDISNPLEMKLLDFWELPVNTVTDLCKRGDVFICTVNYTSGEGISGNKIVSYDLSDSANPKVVGEYTDIYFPQYMAPDVDGKTIYVQGLTDQIHALDISDPANIKLLWNDPTILGANRRAMGVASVGDYVFAPTLVPTAFGYSSFVTLNSQDKTNLTRVAAYELNGYNFFNFLPVNDYDAWACFKTANSNGYYYTWANKFSISNPTSIYPLRDPVSMDGESYSVDFKGNYAYIADYLNGLVIADVSNPEKLSLVKKIACDGYVYRAIVDGNSLYVCAGVDGLFIYNIENPAEPVEIAHYPSPQARDALGQIYDSTIKDCYITDGIAHIASELQMLELSYYGGTYHAEEVHYSVLELADIEKYIAEGTGATLFITSTSGDCDGMRRVGNYDILYGGDGYVVYDTTISTNVSYNGNFAIPEFTRGLVIPEETAPYGYACTGTNNIAIIDFSDAANLGTASTEYSTNQVVVKTNFQIPSNKIGGITYKDSNLLVGNSNEGLSLVKVTEDPLVLEFAANIDLWGYQYDAFLSDDGKYIYAAAEELGLAIIKKEETPEPPPGEEITIVSWKYSTNSFTLTLSSVPESFTVEASSDMKNWKKVGFVLIGSNVIIPGSVYAGNDQTFFRIKQ